MSINASTIFENLRIPDVIRDLPAFDGNPNAVNSFINRVDQILNLIPNIGSLDYRVLLHIGIRNKIIGQPSHQLDASGISIDWNETKNFLLLKYGERRDEATLLSDLYKINQDHQNIDDFFQKILEIKSKLIYQVNNDNHSEEIKTSKKKLYEKCCLSVFLNGLNEEIGINLCLMDPETLDKAYEMCKRVENRLCERNQSNSFYNRNNYYSQNNQYKRENQNFCVDASEDPTGI